MEKKNNLEEAVGLEIERKFLVVHNQWPRHQPGIYFKQGYISTHKTGVVRVRVAGKKAFLTVKGENKGSSRLEFEYQIPVQEAEVMLRELCRKPLIEKTRYSIKYRGKTWEIDEFHGENRGLIIAEVELESPEEVFLKPPWAAEDVTGDSRYFNSNLCSAPFCSWPS